MHSRKARKPAAAGAARGSRSARAGRLKQSEAYTTNLLVVYSGRTCLGHILSRGREGYEAYDINDASLGIFSDQDAAADAVSLATGRRA